MAMTGDTLGFLESSWNRGILSQMGMKPNRESITPLGIGIAEPCGVIAVVVRFLSIRHTSARFGGPIKIRLPYR